MVSELLERAEAMADWMTEIRRDLHRHPELGFEERRTADRVRRELAAMGIEVRPCGLETAVVGLIRGGGGGPVTGLRADLDALPIAEQTGLPYASIVPGVMHACGHDGHTAALLGAARLLAERRDRLRGAVLLLFQPAEEGVRGARAMIADGALRDPAPDAVFALHGWPSLPIGRIGWRIGPAMAAADRFACEIRGRGAHAAHPHAAADPILAAAHAVVALQQVVSRRLDPLQPAVLSICEIHGGTTHNIIPETASFVGTTRSHDEGVRRSLEGLMRGVLEGICAASGCSFQLDYRYENPQLVNDRAMTELILRAAGELLGPDAAVELPPSMGAEDFSQMIEAAGGRGALFRLGLQRPGAPPMAGLHNARFDFSDEALPVGAAMLARIALLCSDGQVPRRP